MFTRLKVYIDVVVVVVSNGIQTMVSLPLYGFDELTVSLASFKQDYVGIFGRNDDDWTADVPFSHPQNAELSFPIMFSFLITLCFGLLPLIWMAFCSTNTLDISTNRHHLYYQKQ